MDEDRAADPLVAVTEGTTKSIRHGAGRGVLRIWRQDGRLVCEVADAGRRIQDPLAGRLKAGPDETSGRGLWLIHQLCDLVEVRSSDLGNLVRMHVYC